MNILHLSYTAPAGDVDVTQIEIEGGLVKTIVSIKKGSAFLKEVATTVETKTEQVAGSEENETEQAGETSPAAESSETSPAEFVAKQRNL